MGSRGGCLKKGGRGAGTPLRTMSKAHRALNLEMAKILKEKVFNDVLPGEKLGNV